MARYRLVEDELPRGVYYLVAVLATNGENEEDWGVEGEYAFGPSDYDLVIVPVSPGGLDIYLYDGEEEEENA